MVPGDSRTSVQHTTCVSLTAGFGMRPGVSRQLWPLSPHDLLFLFAAEELDAILRQIGIPFLESDPSQGPDLNRSVVDLQSTAWPLRHLGDRVG